MTRRRLLARLLAPLAVLLLGAAPTLAAQADGAAPVVGGSIIDAIDRFFGTVIVTPLTTIFFYDVMFWDNDSATNIQLPIVVLWLVMGSVYLTLRMGFINLRGFAHAINVTRGKYSNPEDLGEVSHFQALTTALSATVGLGNIGGVAVAIALGGPGAIFWMWVVGVFGMALKTTEVTQSMLFRNTKKADDPHGGPMWVVEEGLAQRNPRWRPIGHHHPDHERHCHLPAPEPGGSWCTAPSACRIVHTPWRSPPTPIRCRCRPGSTPAEC